MAFLRPINTIGDATRSGQAVGMEGPAQIKALYLCYEVDNAENDDTDFDDIIGTLVVKVFGQKQPTGDRAALSRPQSLVSAVDAIGGRCRTESTTGGAARHILKIPYGLPYDDNVLFLRREQRLLVYVPQFDATNVDAVSCTVYAEIDRGGVARYNLIHIDEQITLGGLRRMPLTRDGLVGLVLSEGSTTNPDNWALMDGAHRLTWGEWDDYQGVFQSSLEIEADMTYEDLVFDPTSRGRELWQAIYGDLTLELDGGSGTITVHQLIQDRHVGGALEESLRFRAGGHQAVRTELSETGTAASITEALVPRPSLSPEIEPHAKLPAGAGGGGGATEAKVPKPPRAKVVTPGFPSGGVLKRIR